MAVIKVPVNSNYVVGSGNAPAFVKVITKKASDNSVIDARDIPIAEVTGGYVSFSLAIDPVSVGAIVVDNYLTNGGGTQITPTQSVGMGVQTQTSQAEAG